MACQLVEEADLSYYQASYDDKNRRVAAPIPEAENLIPPIRKHTYALDIKPSTLISDEVVFQALTGINWTTIDFQPLGRDEEDEPVQDDPQPSGQAGDHHNPEAGLVFYLLQHLFEKQLSFWALKRLVIG